MVALPPTSDIVYHVSTLRQEVKDSHTYLRLRELTLATGAFRSWLRESPPRVRVVLAEVEGLIIGWVAYHPRAWNSSFRGYRKGPIMGWYVDAAWRGRGIATELTHRITPLLPRASYVSFQPDDAQVDSMLRKAGWVLADPGNYDGAQFASYQQGAR